MKRPLINSCLMFTLSGCAAYYTEPVTNTPQAKIRFVSLADIGMTSADVFFFDSEADMCKKDFMKSKVVASLKGVRLGDNRKDLSLPLGKDYPKEAKTEVSVKANEELRYVMGYDNQSVYITTEYVQGYTGSSSCLIAKTLYA